MLKTIAHLTLVLSALVLPSACATDPTGSEARAIIDTPCADDTECPSGFECEIEVEHGTTTSFCQAEDDSGTCPAGYELEVEHGQAFCKPDGSSGGSGGGADDPAGGSGGADDPAGGSGGASTCATDADCPSGFECETQLEHGTTTTSCRAHGGGTP